MDHQFLFKLQFDQWQLGTNTFLGILYLDVTFLNTFYWETRLPFQDQYFFWGSKPSPNISASFGIGFIFRAKVWTEFRYGM